MMGAPVFGANAKWDGGGGDLIWNDALNWTRNQLPGINDNITFDSAGIATATTITLGASQSARSLQFTTTKPVTVVGAAGQVLTIRNGITVSLGKETIAADIALSQNNLWSVASGTSLTVVGNVSLGNRSLTITDNGTASISGVISGTGALVVNGGGAGLMTLSGASTYSGTTSVLDGTVVIATNAPSGAAGALGNAASAVLVGDTLGSGNAALLTSGAVTIGRVLTVQAGNTGTATLGGSTATASTFSGAITLGKSVMLTAAAGGQATFSGVITDGAGAFGVTKTGAGTVVLGAANTYDGATTISAGTVLVTNVAGSATGTGAVSVASGATLGGTGIIAGALSVASGGTLSPGLPGAVGTLTVGGAVTLSAGSRYVAQIAGVSAGQYDRVNAASVTISAATLVLANTSAVTGTIFTMFTGAVTGTFAGLAEATSFPSGGRLLRISYVGGVTLTDLGPTPLPNIATVSPNVGYTLGGTTVTLSGYNLDTTSSVTIGGVTAAIVSTSLTSAVVTTGAHAVGLVDVVLTNAFGTTTATAAYTYQLPPLTITANDRIRAYGAANPTLTYTLVGLLGADTEATALATPVTTATIATTANVVGVYPITVGGATSFTYAITFVDGNLAIDPAPLTIAAANKAKLQGAVNPALTYAVTGFVNGDTEASAFSTPVLIATTAVTASIVGTYPITVSDASANNYAITFVDATMWVVAPAPLPTITSISPNSGPALGGQTVTITGTNLDGAITDLFGGAAATVVTISTTSVVVVTPAHALGLVNVVVTTP
ncbi:MAG: IPT/TIG domain-containing protein, partial [Planctomycetes bacterium]|nr:IPT/TIG domain-containing protein [Planctomycetota bacterium]